MVDPLRDGGLDAAPAQAGADLRGRAALTDATKAEMKKVLAEVQDGTFAKNWMDECHGGLKKYNEYKQQDSEHLLETTGKEPRKLMSWVDEEA
ncbi:hypothetical protein AB0E81_38195 [Streptomyces sp. NPDC033538]|uniref:hypothetical protein n=1 Tax=Streptomyces sp. NPDC033538 TaxID=3155367 RepID=UPI0033C23896